MSYLHTLLDAKITLDRFISPLSFSAQLMFRNVKCFHLSTDVLIQEISDVQLWKRQRKHEALWTGEPLTKSRVL